MTIIALDYGTKRVGVAVSDASETLAFPREVIDNKGRTELVERVRVILAAEKARMVVLGHSRDSAGADNPVMGDVRAFKAMLEAAGVSVVFQEESWSSAEASRFQGATPLLDASAAAIILQRFLDIQRTQS